MSGDPVIRPKPGVCGFMAGIDRRKMDRRRAHDTDTDLLEAADRRHRERRQFAEEPSAPSGLAPLGDEE